MNFTVGSMVRARRRDWIVQPGSENGLLRLRPLVGTDAETATLDTRLEEVEEAQFCLPQAAATADWRSARLLRTAMRLGFRAGAGPFRSFANLNFEPHPWQLVPLLMALRQPVVRQLIADDVGVGKTIEALLIARELLDRGEIGRMAVLCPPQLAEQWQRELRDKFHIDATLVLTSTATRLERRLSLGSSIFEQHGCVVVSLDFIKSERRREEFLRAAPEFVIVDEAHTAAHVAAHGRRHQRHELVARLAKQRGRHLLLVTATPHSGVEDAFRSLLTMLNPDFAELPDDLSGPQNEAKRRELAGYFVQRRRANLNDFAGHATPFPQRQNAELSWHLEPEGLRLFNRALTWSRELVRLPGEGWQQRVRWWSALALLRSLASSPRAAAATLRSRAAPAATEDLEQVDELGRRAVLDMMGEETAEGIDVLPGSDVGELAQDAKGNRDRLLAMARAAEKLEGAADPKLQRATEIIRELVEDGYNPIVFCRFIPTVEYVSENLRAALPEVEVTGVSGLLPPAEREHRVNQLGRAQRRVLVCTDCLSEGINLQQHFDAVLHYDLSWNPTRHEQREGRVDRFGQPREQVRVVTLFGADNRIDGIVLDVLLRKHRTIRRSLGISVPVPGNSGEVIEAILEGLLLRETASLEQVALPGLEAQREKLNAQWEAAEARERASQAMFAQRRISVAEVAEELGAAQAAGGSQADVAAFLSDAARMAGGSVSENGPALTVDLRAAPRDLRERLGQERFTARFQPPLRKGELLLTRTHPLVANLAAWTLDNALDSSAGEDDVPRAGRAGVIRTKAVKRMTTLLLLRLRMHLVTTSQQRLLAEDCLTLAYEGLPHKARWLNSEQVEALLQAEPTANIPPAQARQTLQRALDDYSEALAPQLEKFARERADELLEAHGRVRQATGDSDSGPGVEPHLPPDVLGLYVYLPVPERV